MIHYFGVAGADEAGRGPLAGPVVAAAVILPEGFDTRGVDDSKKMRPADREELYVRILAGAKVSLEFADVDEIDRRNILHASEAAMSRAIQRLNPSKVFVDGHRIPPGLTCPAEAVVKGDGKISCIAAASIVAKVARDSAMIALAQVFPGYGFDQHFGYPTPDHLESLRRLGPCPAHRRSFGPVRELVEQRSLFD